MISVAKTFKVTQIKRPDFTEDDHYSVLAIMENFGIIHYLVANDNGEPIWLLVETDNKPFRIVGEIEKGGG